MIKTSISGVQSVQDAIAKELKKYTDAPSVVVGIRGEAGKHEGTDITMAQLGAIHEFGTPTIPERPFLVPGVKAAESDITKAVIKFLPKDGMDRTLGLVGQIAQNSVQKYMRDLKTPPNAPSTIAAKKSSNPLIDTGALIGSISYEVTTDGLEEGL